MNTRAVPPVLGAPITPRLPPPLHYRLKNGLEAIVVERTELPVVDAQIVVRSGAAVDDAVSAGRIYLMADLLDQGTATRGATEIADQAELLGASLHTRGGWDFSAVALHVLTPRLAPALDLLADITLRPTFPEAEFQRKRAERLAAILQEEDEPRALASQEFARVLYGASHPFGLPLGGTRASVERLDVEDVRTFYRRHFMPDNAYLVVVGDVRPDQLVPLLEDLFAGWGGAAVPASAAVPAGVATRGVHVVDVPGAAQSELRVGLPGPPRLTTDYFPLLVGNSILGGAFTSRLNMRLREEKAYTYGAGSSFALRRAGGPFVASTAVNTSASADAVADMVREIGRMAQEPVSAAELERAQNYLVLGLPRTFETTGDIAEHVSEVALYGLGDDYFDRFAERVRAVTAADIQHASARWLRADELAVVIAGDAAAIRQDVAALDFGEVHVRTDG